MNRILLAASTLAAVPTFAQTPPAVQPQAAAASSDAAPGAAKPAPTMRPTTGPRFNWKSDVGEYLTWVRFVEEPACHPAVALLAMGDALPPAAMALFTEFGPISSMNWTVNMLTAKPETDDGWWLLRASNTQAVLVARCEAKTEAGLERLKSALVAQLAASGLAAPDFSGSNAGH